MLGNRNFSPSLSFLPGSHNTAKTPGSKLVFVLACAVIAMGAGVPEVRAQSPCEDSAPFGSLLNSAEFDASVQALPPAAFHIPPLAAPKLGPQAFLSNLPAVSQQGTAASPGSPGSCEAQSFGYGLGSYTAALKPDGSPKWNPALPQFSVSAAYLYELEHLKENRACPTGSLALGYLAQLVSLGAPTRGQVPYKADCTYLDTIPQQPDFPNNYPGMQNFLIGSYAAFHIDTNPAAAVDLIKQFISAGQAVAFSGKVLCGYGKTPQFQNGVIYETATVPPPSGHGQLVVGYNDKAGTPGNTGALLIQNSFGTTWPPTSGGKSAAPAGMAYWSYNSFETTQLLAAVAYPRSTSIAGALLLRASSSAAPTAAIGRAFQWAPGTEPGAYLILTHIFLEPALLDSVMLTEPGSAPVTATAVYGQYISNGYSYLKRTDGSAFLAGTYKLTLNGHDLKGQAVTYTGSVKIGGSRPVTAAGKSMAGQSITGSTGAPATLSP
ncbi:hypothetical protein QEV83_12050 [Methylocapsa sp. D3K7]|uniref:hypothetical protein n=1 Tax=Methylocapsa sp. D3K7 TaxID=3041435 RepID=UPI00244ECD50|nr:hypothetical protein [Methylocapsa sp. D3K7]WGJ13431.1 hypothetical protein QEV83_12050 [Methylocapsa sp. D3K7]